MKPHQYTTPKDKVLILKVIPKNRMCHNEFPFPEGIGTKVIPTSWTPEAICGGGIHGWPWGFGLGEGKDINLDGIWLVLEDKPRILLGNLKVD